MTIPFNINTYTGSVQLNGLDYEVKAQFEYRENRCGFIEFEMPVFSPPKW